MIYKYFKDTSKHAVNDFKNDRISFKHVSKFNDSLEFDALFDESISLENTQLEEYGRELLFAQISEQKFRIRVFCASINGNNEHLWKNYANNSHGFCLGYDENEIKLQSNNIIMRKVEYSDDIPRLSNDNIESAVINQIFHKSLKSNWPKEEEFRIVLFLDEKDIKVEKYTYLSELKNIVTSPEDITIQTEIPVNHLTRKNNEPPIFERKTAPLIVYLPIKPKLIIIGKACSDEIRTELIDEANKKGILVKKQGDIND